MNQETKEILTFLAEQFRQEAHLSNVRGDLPNNSDSDIEQGIAFAYNLAAATLRSVIVTEGIDFLNREVWELPEKKEC